VAIDRDGYEVVLAPGSSSASRKPVDDNSANALDGVACPSAAQCTAVDAVGQELTFEPATPSAVHVAMIDPTSFGGLAGIACPSATQCTAIADAVAPVDGTTPFPRELTFDPRHPGTPKIVAVGPKRALLNGIACPSAHQCTTVTQGGQAITFNPSAPADARTTRISSGPLGALQAITCPNTTQCTALDEGGIETTFDPRAPAHRSKFGLGSPDGSGISCPTVDQCTATVRGTETFDPHAPRRHPRFDAPLVHGTTISCPHSRLCLVAGTHISEGDPRRPANWKLVAIGVAYPPSVACDSRPRAQCVVVDADGDEFAGP